MRRPLRFLFNLVDHAINTKDINKGIVITTKGNTLKLVQALPPPVIITKGVDQGLPLKLHQAFPPHALITTKATTLMLVDQALPPHATKGTAIINKGIIMTTRDIIVTTMHVIRDLSRRAHRGRQRSRTITITRPAYTK